MKKLLSLLLVLVITLSLCGCSEEQSHKDLKTIKASNGDEINVQLIDGESPAVTVSVNDKEICSFDNFAKHKDDYDFDKDFSVKATDEYSNDKILWAYKFDWGVIYSVKHDYSNTESTDDDTTLTFVCPKHDYKKCYFKNVYFYKLAENWDLIEFDAIEETGKEIFWDSYTAAQVVFEDLYKTEDYKLIEINDLTKAGYSIDDYYEIHNHAFASGAGLNEWQKIYEVSVKGKPFALIYSDASSAYFLL